MRGSSIQSNWCSGEPKGAGWDDLPEEGQPTETCHRLPQVTTAFRGPTVHLPAGYREPTVRRLNFDEEPRIHTNQHEFHFGLAVLRPFRPRCL